MTRAKVFVGLAVLAAFLAGTVLAGYIAPKFNSASAAVPARTAMTSEPAPRRVIVERARPVRHRRSLEREVLIVAGGGGGGAASCGAARGGEGAAVGGPTAGVARRGYEPATRNR